MNPGGPEAVSGKNITPVEKAQRFADRLREVVENPDELRASVEGLVDSIKSAGPIVNWNNKQLVLVGALLGLGSSEGDEIDVHLGLEKLTRKSGDDFLKSAQRVTRLTLRCFEGMGDEGIRRVEQIAGREESFREEARRCLEVLKEIGGLKDSKGEEAGKFLGENYDLAVRIFKNAAEGDFERRGNNGIALGGVKVGFGMYDNFYSSKDGCAFVSGLSEKKVASFAAYFGQKNEACLRILYGNGMQLVLRPDFDKDGVVRTAEYENENFETGEILRQGTLS